MLSTTQILTQGTRKEIPLAKETPYTRQRVSLDGRAYLLDLAWNQRVGRWHISLLDAEAVPILSGAKLVPNWPLLRFKKWDTRCPPGELIASDDGSGDDIGFFDIGGDSPRVALVYYAVEIT